MGCAGLDTSSMDANRDIEPRHSMDLPRRIPQGRI
jgi:hypothetical protein